jgi:acetaldehyde dehydrogenase (acetylating)
MANPEELVAVRKIRCPLATVPVVGAAVMARAVVGVKEIVASVVGRVIGPVVTVTVVAGTVTVAVAVAVVELVEQAPTIINRIVKAIAEEPMNNRR